LKEFDSDSAAGEQKVACLDRRLNGRSRLGQAVTFNTVNVLNLMEEIGSNVEVESMKARKLV
jgi:hypothetical protein